MQKVNIRFLLIIFILFFAIFLRVFKLNSIPSELFGDELDVGYQAYSILKTGKDLYGNLLPTYIQSLSESRAPLFIYSAVPFVGIFGLNEWGVRLTAVFWGILGVVAIYFLTQKLFQNTKLSFLAASFLAISPWHIHYSRAGFEVTLLIFILMMATVFFIEGLKKPSFLIFSSLFLALTPYTYSTATVFTPLLIVGLLVIFRKEISSLVRTSQFKIAVLVFFIVLIPFGLQTVFGRASARFSAISVAVNPEIVKNINESRSLDQNFPWAFHNKPLSFLHEFSRNYVSAFSPQFLFSDGDPIGRHSVGQMGQFYWFMLPLLLFGIFKIFVSTENKKHRDLLLIWLILAPIPTSLTYNGASHATRLFLLLPPLIILSSIGAYHISTGPISVKKKIALIFIILAIAVVNLTTFTHRYFAHYSKESWRWWQIGYKEGFMYIAENQDKYQKVLINNTYEPSLIRFLFYTKYDPALFQKNFDIDQPKKEIISRFDGFKIGDKYYFGTLSSANKGADEISKVLDESTVYFASQRDEIIGLDLRKQKPDNIVVLKTITNYLDEPIFYLLTGK